MEDINEIIYNEILDLRDEFLERYNLKEYSDINLGYCSHFAKELKNRLKTKNVKIRIIDSDTLKIIPEDKDFSPWDEKKILKKGLKLFNYPTCNK